MRRYIVPLLVVLLVVGAASPVVADTEGSPNLSVHLPDNRVAAGEETTLAVFLLNSGTISNGGPPNEESRVTTARDVTVTVVGGSVPVEVKTDTQPVGNVPEGRVGPIEFAVSVAEDASPGRYFLPVSVSYEYTSEIDSSGRDGDHTTRRVTVRRSVALVVVERARIVGLNAGTEAPVGGSGELTLTLQNAGSDVANAARVTLESLDPALSFGGAPTASVYVGSWAPGERETVSVRGQVAPGIDPRSLPIAATVSFEDDDGVRQASDRLTFGVMPRAEQSFALEHVTSTLAVGDEGTFRADVTNTGETPVRNAVVVFSAGNDNVVPVETEHAVGDLAPGESATFSFEAEVSDSADSGPRQLSFVVRYRDATDEVRRSDPVDARIQVGPRQGQFAVEPVSATLAAGESGVLELEITNDGDQVVTDVSAKLFADSPLSSDDDEAFVERLEPGDSTTVRFSLTAGGDALRKVYPVSMDFQYDDAEGDTRLSDTYKVPVEVTGSQGGGLSAAIVGLVILLVVAILAGGWYRRQR